MTHTSQRSKFTEEVNQKHSLLDELMRHFGDQDEEKKEEKKEEI